MRRPAPATEWIIAPDADAAARETAERTAASLASAARERGRAALALAGGSTPRAAYRLLAAEPLRSRVPWGSVEFFFGDERGVPPSHADANYRMAREELLEPLAIPAARVRRMEAEREDREAAAAEYEQAVRASLAPRGGEPAFDLVLLGMGPDGHTASLFPGSPALDERHRLVVAVRRPEGRFGLTVTLPAIEAAREVILCATGAPKAEMLRRVRSGDRSLPAARVRPRGRLLWIVDRALAEAAGLAPS